MSQTRKREETDGNPLRSPNSLRPIPTEYENLDQTSLAPFPSLAPDSQITRRTTRFSLPPLSGAPPRARTSFLATRPSTFDAPSFNLAGLNTPIRARDASGTYVDPEYTAFAAPANWPQDAPIWGLAKPLPRVVRPGMRRGGTSHDDTDAIGGQEKGDVEAAPQVQQTPGVHQIQSGDHENQRRTAQSRLSMMRSRPEHEQSLHSNDAQNQDEIQAGSLHSIHSPTRYKSRGADQPMENDLEIPPAIPEGEVFQPEEQSRPEDAPEEGNGPEFLNRWSEIRHKLREPLAECLGTAIALIIGFCGSLSVTTSSDTAGNFQSGNWAWGFGIMLGIYISGGISGAHFNPAISIMLSVFRGFPWRRCGIYCICQFLGALVAAGITFGLYRDAILHLDGRQYIPSSTGVAFYTSPKSWVSPATAFFNELVASAILGCAILALGDDTNAPPGAGMHAFIIGLLVAVLSMCFSYNSGACLNPVRDLAPRLVALMAGYGGSVFTEYDCWWIWGPFVADITGVLLGAFIYDAFVFVGGESPINYPPRRRKRARMKFAARWSRRVGRRDSKVRKYEKKVEENGE